MPPGGEDWNDNPTNRSVPLDVSSQREVSDVVEGEDQKNAGENTEQIQTSGTANNQFATVNGPVTLNTNIIQAQSSEQRFHISELSLWHVPPYLTSTCSLSSASQCVDLLERSWQATRIALLQTRIDATAFLIVNSTRHGQFGPLEVSIPEFGSSSGAEYQRHFHPDDAEQENEPHLGDFGSNVVGQTVTLLEFINQLPRRGQETVCLLELHRLGGRSGSIIRNDVLELAAGVQRTTVAEALRQRNIFLVVLADCSEEDVISITNAFPITLSPDLDTEQEIIVELASRQASAEPHIFSSILNDQLAAGYWGDDKTKRLQALLDDHIAGTLPDNVKKNIQQYVEDGRKEYAARLRTLLGLSGDVTKSDIIAKITGRVFGDDETELLVCCILFAVTQFENLTARELDWLVQNLLSGKKIIRERHIVTLPRRETAGYVDTSNELAGTSAVDDEIEMSSFAKHNLDHFLRILDIKLQSNGFLDFEPPFKRDVARHVFRTERSILHSRLLTQDSIEKSLIFESSHNLATQFATAYADHIRQLPERARADCLTDWMQSSAHMFIESRVPNFRADKGEFSQFSRFIELLLREHLSQVYVDRMSLLFAELLRTMETRALVNNALLNLVAFGPQQRFDVILDFVRVLRRYEGFDTIGWIKRLLSQGDETTKKKCVRLLVSLLESELNRTNWIKNTPILRETASWAPENSEQVSTLNNRSAALLAPRLALYRYLAHIDRQVETGHQPLIELFEWRNIYAEANGNVQSLFSLLAFPTSGGWIKYDLIELEGFLREVWKLVPCARATKHDASKLPILVSITAGIPGGLLGELSESDLGFQVLLIEMVKLNIGDFNNLPVAEENAAAALVNNVGQNVGAGRAHTLARLAYHFRECLRLGVNDATYNRAVSAKFVGDLLWDAKCC